MAKKSQGRGADSGDEAVPTPSPGEGPPEAPGTSPPPAEPGADAKIPAAASPPPAASPSPAPTPEAGDDRDVMPKPALGGEVPTRSSSRPEDVRIILEVVAGSILDRDGLVAVIGRYEDTAPAGAIHELDKALGGLWIKGEIDLGIIGSSLGELSYLPTKSKELKISGVILAGMGEPGRFSRDNLRYLMTNVVTRVRNMGLTEFASVLIGAGGNGLPIDRALRGLLEGARDAIRRRTEAKLDALSIVIAEADPDRAKAIHKAAGGLGAIEGITLEVGPEKWIAPQTNGSDSEEAEETPSSLEPDVPTTRITITTDSDLDGDGDPILQYSALGQTATISVREERVGSCFAKDLPGRLSQARSANEQEFLGQLMAIYFLPEDFQHLLDESSSLTLVLDAKTARFPWEMAAIPGCGGVRAFGPHLRLTRQFRSLTTAAPGMPPPINKELRALIIADPSTWPHPLPNARAEAVAVLNALVVAKSKLGDRIDLRVTVRVGSKETDNWLGIKHWLETEVPDCRVAMDQSGSSKAVDVCDPLDILGLMLTQHFDVVHYAGHGVHDPSIGMGWVFSQRCILSAKEIFKVRQVPRLVFSNACHTADVDAPKGGVPPSVQQTGLAQAFFARGIQNYIGAGWKVDDKLAARFAQDFYLQALGLERKAPDPSVSAGTIEYTPFSPPATLGEALAVARGNLIALNDGTTNWGAYQHYGQVNAKLIDLPNQDAPKEAMEGGDTAPGRDP